MQRTLRMRTRMRMSECQDARMPVPKMLPLLSQAPRQKFPSSSICKDKLGVRGPASGAWSLGSNFNNSQVQWSVLPTANVLVAPGPATRSCEMKSKPSFHHFIWHFLHFFFFSALSLHLLFIFLFLFYPATSFWPTRISPYSLIRHCHCHFLNVWECVRTLHLPLARTFAASGKPAKAKSFICTVFFFLNFCCENHLPPPGVRNCQLAICSNKSKNIYVCTCLCTR